MAARDTRPHDTLAIAPDDVPSADRDAIGGYIRALHELAAPYAQAGQLMIAHQDARRVDDKRSFEFARYAIGPEHAERMAGDIVGFSSNLHTNVWSELRVVKKGASKRGTKADTLAVPALAVDDDVDAGMEAAKLCVEPTRILQTSAKNRQLQFVFKEPLTPDVADRLGSKLRKLSGADACTGNSVQPYRIPGTLNWPTPKKVRERARSPIPFVVREVGGSGKAIDAEEFEKVLDAALEPAADPKPGASQQGRRSEEKKSSGKPNLSNLSQQQRYLLQHIGNEAIDRSGMWQSVCWRLFGKGFRPVDVAEFLDPFAKDCPEGFAAKFTGRVTEEVQRSFEKFREREECRGAGPRTGKSKDAAPQPSWLPKGFWVEGSAIYTEVDTNVEVLTKLVCSVFEFIGIAADDTTNEQVLIIDVPNKLNPQRKSQVLIPRAHLADSGNLYRATLLTHGLEIPGNGLARKKLHELLNALQRTDDIRLATQTGWFKNSFVTRSSVVRAPDDLACYIHRLAVEPSSESATRGTLTDWNNGVGRFIEPNSNLVVAACQAMSGPILKLVGASSSVLHFVGDSSTGKTTVLQAALSVAGKPVFGETLETWRVTDNALENTLAARNDLCLGLDEMSQVTAKAASQAAYMIAQGAGKNRMARSGEPLRTRRWRCSVLSTGEIDLETKLAEAGEMARAGQEVRVISVPAEAGKGFGAFDDLCGTNSGEALAEHLREAALQTFGTPMVAWIECLVAHPDQLLEQVRSLRQQHKAQLLATQRGPVSGQASRVADHFALLAAAGETSIMQGIFTWKSGAAFAAVLAVFERWLAARGGVGPAEHGRMLRALRSAVETRQQAFLPMGGSPDHKPHEVLGYIDDEEGGSGTRRRAGPRRVMLTASGFTIVFKGFRREAVVAFMTAGEYLLPARSEPTITVRPEGGGPKVRVYAFDLARVLGATEQNEAQSEGTRAAEEAFGVAEEAA